MNARPHPPNGRWHWRLVMAACSQPLARWPMTWPTLWPRMQSWRPGFQALPGSGWLSSAERTSSLPSGLPHPPSMPTTGLCLHTGTRSLQPSAPKSRKEPRTPPRDVVRPMNRGRLHLVDIASVNEGRSGNAVSAAPPQPDVTSRASPNAGALLPNFGLPKRSTWPRAGAALAAVTRGCSAATLFGAASVALMPATAPRALLGHVLGHSSPPCQSLVAESRCSLGCLLAGTQTRACTNKCCPLPSLSPGLLRRHRQRLHALRPKRLRRRLVHRQLRRNRRPLDLSGSSLE